jgi:hypothetical protein
MKNFSSLNFRFYRNDIYEFCAKNELFRVFMYKISIFVVSILFVILIQSCLSYDLHAFYQERQILSLRWSSKFQDF